MTDPLAHKVAERHRNHQMAKRLAAKLFGTVAMEHDTPEALKTYLHEHPGADPKNHSVKKPGGAGAGGGDHAVAEAEGKKSQARFDENKKSLSEMKGLQGKVDNADPSAKKKFDRAYDKMYESGEKAAGTAKKLLSKYEDAPDSLKGDAKKQCEAALNLLDRYTQHWESNKVHHLSESHGFASKKLQQAHNTYGAAQQLEAVIKDFHKSLKGESHTLDDSWRH